MKSLAMTFLWLSLPLSTQAEEQSQDLGKIETELKSAPNDPMLHYRKCQALFAAGKEQEAIDHAAVALKKFKEANNDLAWMKLGTFTTDQYRVDVHYNMGPKERAEQKDGIVRPYSFRVWSRETPSKLIRVIDFELGCFEGEIATAALGTTTSEGHNNFGVLDPKSDYAAVKKRLLEILAK